MFVLKKILTLFMMPFTVSLGVLGGGILLLWARRGVRAAKIMLTLGFLSLTALSFSAVADQFIKPLESRYPPLVDTANLKNVKWVVVLGGGQASNPDYPANAQIGNSSLARLVEGVRLHRLVPESKLLLSGGAVFDPSPEAVIMAAVARMLGISQDDMVLETQSKDTEQQAIRVRELLGSEPCVLVTSAVHMPRAMLVFEQVGMRPIPAPVDFSDWMRNNSDPRQFFPGPNELRKVESALHEYLGLLWVFLRG